MFGWKGEKILEEEEAGLLSEIGEGEGLQWL
jgi:hypothetical protein